MSTPLFESPNLDGLSVDPADYDEASRVLRLLALYADAKSHAIRRRLSGNIAEALIYERNAERIYQSLPDWAKW